MLRTRTRIARVLDRIALALYAAGERIAGERGGRLADAVSDASMGPVRTLLAVPCTCGLTDCPGEL